MMELKRAMFGIAQWFARNNIQTDSVTVILNIADREVAGQFDGAFKRDLDAELIGQVSRTGDVRRMTINGLKIKIESPLHPA